MGVPTRRAIARLLTAARAPSAAGMSTGIGPRALPAALILILSLAACGGESLSGPGGPATTPPPAAERAVGDLQVTVATNGEDADPDGYTLILSRAENHAEARTISADGTATFANLSPGTYTVELDDVAYNCAVAGGNPRAANVAAETTFEMSFSVGCRFIEGRLDFHIAPDAPQAEVSLVQAGLDRGQDYLDAEVGGGIPRRVRDTIPVRIVATGRGNEEPGGGACCTALSTSPNGASIVRLFFDVAHTGWLDRSARLPWSRQADRRARAAREYALAWQHELGCLDPARSLVGWLREGIARWVGYQALITSGAVAAAEVLDYARRSAAEAGQLSRPLASLAATDSPSSSDHVGYLAVDWLVQAAPDGPLALRSVCEAVGAGDELEPAFEAAFGTSVERFYADFTAAFAQEAASDGEEGAPPGIAFGGLSGLDSSNAPFVHFALSGSVVDRNGDGTAVTSAVVRVTVDPGSNGDCPGALESQEETGISPSDEDPSDPVAVDVTAQVNANGGRWTVEFRADNLLRLSGLAEVTYCFEVVADDGAKRKDGSDDGVQASAFVAKDFTWF